jgi:hypothetical protein
MALSIWWHIDVLSSRWNDKRTAYLQKIQESRVMYLKKTYLCGRKSLKNGIELKWLQEKAERIP